VKSIRLEKSEHQQHFAVCNICRHWSRCSRLMQ